MRNALRPSDWWLIAAALAIGVTVVSADNIAFSLLTGRPFVWAANVEPFNMACAAFPFLVLALAGARKWLPWLLGIAATLGLWGWCLYDGVSYQWHQDGSGADIGLGLILLASPLFITALCLGAYRLSWSRDRAA